MPLYTTLLNDVVLAHALGYMITVRFHCGEGDDTLSGKG